MDVYLAGPMRGHAEYNFPAFFEAANYLISRGHDVRNPALHDIEDGIDPTRDLDDQPGMAGGRFDLHAAFAWDAQQVCAAEAIVLLPGWRGSSGASLEYAIAKMLGKDCFEYDPNVTYYPRLFPVLEEPDRTPVTADESVLEEAQRLIHGERNESYGHPLDDFTATANYWHTWVEHKYGVDVPFEAHDVALMMSLLKHSREGANKKRDNKVDICGYLGTSEMCEDEQALRDAA